MSDIFYDVELIPFIYGSKNWTVYTTMNGKIYGRSRAFRTKFMATLYFNRMRRQIPRRYR